MKRVYLLLLCLFSVLVMQAQNWEYIFNGKTARHEIQGDCRTTGYFS